MYYNYKRDKGFAMSSVGEVLKRARLDQELDLETVAARTKISVRCLTAIEADDRKALPSGFFYRSFVDQYARLLSLDTRAINAEVDHLLSQDEPLPLPGYEAVVSRSVSPMKAKRRFGGGKVLASSALLVAVVVGCSGIYAWWRSARVRPSIVSASPRVKQAEVPVSLPPARPVAVAHRAETVAPNVEMASSPAPSSPAASNPAPSNLATSNSEAANAVEDASYKVLLDLMAREETWVSVSSDGKRLFSGILARNQTKTVAGKETATLKVGNAAGLEVRLNGKLLGPLGARGQVLVVVFTPGDYQIVPPAPREGD